MNGRRRRASPRVDGKRAGFALLAVIWGTGLIALLVSAFVSAGRLRLQGAFNIASATQAAYIAESAINLSALTLLSRRDVLTPGEEGINDGAPKFCVLNGAAVALAVEDEGGKVDLNAAPPEVLRAALAGFGLDERKAQEAAGAIAAYRAAPAGGLDAIVPTPKSDKPIAPKQAPFETVMELDQVSGIDAALFRALLPFVTVHSRSAGVDARSSPPALFAALAGFPLEQVRALAAAPYPNDLNRKDPRFPANLNMSSDGQSAFLIRAEVRLATGQTAVKEAILDMHPQSGKPFAFAEVRRGESRYGERLGAIIAANGPGVPDC